MGQNLYQLFRDETNHTTLFITVYMLSIFEWLNVCSLAGLATRVLTIKDAQAIPQLKEAQMDVVRRMLFLQDCFGFF